MKKKIMILCLVMVILMVAGAAGAFAVNMNNDRAGSGVFCYSHDNCGTFVDSDNDGVCDNYGSRGGAHHGWSHH